MFDRVPAIPTGYAHILAGAGDPTGDSGWRVNRRGGPDANRRAKLLICQAMEGSILDAYLHLSGQMTTLAMAFRAQADVLKKKRKKKT